MSLAHVLIAVLAVWRLTHLVHVESGPFLLIARLRGVLGASQAGKLIDCFYCLSLWMAALIAPWLASGWVDGAMIWLGLSGGAIILQRMLPLEARYYEDA